LDGVRILCLAQQYPGPYATLLLADLGADVVLVERPGTGDPARRYPEFFAALNRGKRSVALDLKTDEGRAACRALARRSDVLIEGFRPGVAGRLGLDPASLRAEHPGLIYVSISGFGQDGPYRDRPAHDLSYLALSGLLARGDGGAPQVPVLSLADLSAGLFGALATLCGLVARGRSGVGGNYDVSMFDTLVSLLTSIVGPQLNGAADEGLGSDPGYGVYATADGRWMTLSIAFEDHFWRALCDAAQLNDFADLDAGERERRAEELRGVLAARIARLPAQEWGALLEDADVPHALVRSPAELASDSHVAQRALLQTVGGRTFVRQPLVIDAVRPGPRCGAPELGANTDEVLAEWAELAEVG
jgi:crotonobetainyl-CoA:carnitine CoA-transferase CaiB-like acyl-CoA transferase